MCGPFSKYPYSCFHRKGRAACEVFDRPVEVIAMTFTLGREEEGIVERAFSNEAVTRLGGSMVKALREAEFRWSRVA
jgi:hypothetical protein